MSRTRRAALLLGGLAASDVSRREAALADRLAPLVDVVVAQRDLDPRRALRLEDLAVRRVPARYAPIGAATVPAELVGRRLAVPVPRGGPLGISQLSDPATTAGAPVASGERTVEVGGSGGRGGRRRKRRRHGFKHGVRVSGSHPRPVHRSPSSTRIRPIRRRSPAARGSRRTSRAKACAAAR